MSAIDLSTNVLTRHLLAPSAVEFARQQKWVIRVGGNEVSPSLSALLPVTRRKRRRLYGIGFDVKLRALFRFQNNNIRSKGLRTYFCFLFCPWAYPYQDDNSVAAATADGGNPYSSPLLELFCTGVCVERGRQAAFAAYKSQNSVSRCVSGWKTMHGFPSSTSAVQFNNFN